MLLLCLFCSIVVYVFVIVFHLRGGTVSGSGFGGGGSSTTSGGTGNAIRGGGACGIGAITTAGGGGGGTLAVGPPIDIDSRMVVRAVCVFSLSGCGWTSSSSLGK